MTKELLRPHQDRVEFRVMCPECGDTVHHKCHDASADSVREALLQFLCWVPEFGPHESVRKAMQKEGEKEGWLDKGQDFTKHAFFGAQPWTYALAGKHAGREFSGKIDRLIEAAGLDPTELRQAAYVRMDAERAREAKEVARRENKKSYEQKTIKLFRSKAPLDKKVAVLDQIIAHWTRSLSPMMTRENRTTDDRFLYSTLDHLKVRYDGGINPEVNKQRIEAARKIALDDGVFLVVMFDCAHEPVFEKRFQTEREVTRFLVDASADYDALSVNQFARAVFVRVNQRGVYPDVRYARDKGVVEEGGGFWMKLTPKAAP